MSRALIAAAALAAALLIAVLTSTTPGVMPADTPPTEFSAARAMADVRAISRAPRPTGSAENARVRAYLAARMRQLGMSVGVQAGPLPAASAEKLRKRGNLSAAPSAAVNLVGLLPGRDRSKPAVLLMAHYDSVPASPGAPDDAAGVASGLEILRAIRAQGQPVRDVLLLLTDAEEAGLVGARIFFAGHPLARRVGAVINMESRGGGGRTAMFETGRGNAQWVAVYRRSVDRPFSNSLAVLIYELMPNSTDFTIPKALGRPGFNFAFIGDARLYHSPMATPDRLDQGSLQDMGDQALGVMRALAFAPDLPKPDSDAVFGDVLGLFVIAYQPAVGWAILILSAGLFGFAAWRARGAGELGWKPLAGGVALAFALLLNLALLLRVENLLSGSGGGSNYYDRLAALPRLELQAFFLCAAALLLACVAATRSRHRLTAAAPALALMLLGIIFEGWSPPILGLGVAAMVLAMLVPSRPLATWASWLGIALPLLLLGLAVQIAAPTAGPMLHWPLLIAGAAAAGLAWLDPRMERTGGLLVLATAAALGAGQLLYLAHFTFLGVGAPIPETMTLYALLVAMLLWPLLRGAATPRRFGFGALALVLAATGIALSVRLDPMAETIPPYSQGS